MTSNCVIMLKNIINFCIFFRKHSQKHLRWSKKLENVVQHLCTNDSHVFRVEQKQMTKKTTALEVTKRHLEFCSIKYCEIMDDSAENISKVD